MFAELLATPGRDRVTSLKASGPMAQLVNLPEGVPDAHELAHLDLVSSWARSEVSSALSWLGPNGADLLAKYGADHPGIAPIAQKARDFTTLADTADQRRADLEYSLSNLALRKTLTQNQPSPRVAEYLAGNAASHDQGVHLTDGTSVAPLGPKGNGGVRQV
ncbi:MAG: hypothetical protein WDN72_06755 [Alphaproteobacteria bacterium]